METPRGGTSARATNRLVDRAEDRAARGIEHLDVHAIAEAQERRGGACPRGSSRRRAARRCTSSRRRRARPGAPVRRPPCSTRCPSRRCCRPRARASSRRARSASGNRTSCRRPRSADRTAAPLRCVTSGRCTLPSRQASPSSSGVTATGENALAGFDWTKPKPLASSAGIRLRRLTSFDEHEEQDVPAPLRPRSSHRHVAGDHRDLGLEVDAPRFVGVHDVLARSEHVVGRALVHERVGPEFRRHRRAARAADELDVVHVRGAVGPLVGARQRRHRLRRIERRGVGQPAAHRARRRWRASAGARRVQSSSAACSVRAISGTATQRARSRETTTSSPSRVPSRRVASFIASSPRSARRFSA